MCKRKDTVSGTVKTAVQWVMRIKLSRNYPCSADNNFTIRLQISG